MVSRLTLVRKSHARAGRDREFSHTLCGLSISSEHAGPDLLCRRSGRPPHASSANGRCRPVERPDMRTRNSPRIRSRCVVRLIDSSIGNDAHGAGAVDRRKSSQPMSRPHDCVGRMICSRPGKL